MLVTIHNSWYSRLIGLPLLSITGVNLDDYYVHAVICFCVPLTPGLVYTFGYRGILQTPKPLLARLKIFNVQNIYRAFKYGNGEHFHSIKFPGKIYISPVKLSSAWSFFI